MINVIKFMRQKISIKHKYLILLWFGLRLSIVTLMGFLLILLTNISASKQFLKHSEIIFTIVIFILFVAMWIVWKRATFTRKDFIKFAEGIGVKFIKKRFYPSFWDRFGVYSFAHGFLNDICIVGKIDLPFFAYGPGIAIPKLMRLSRTSYPAEAMHGGWSPAYMEKESNIDLFSLISVPFDIDIELKIDNGKIEIPKTGYLEIDRLLKESLEGADHFHSKLIFNRNCLRMSIIGGSWQGEKFRMKILRGFELFQRIDNELKKKYSVKKWDNFRVRWDSAKVNFYLEAKY